MGLGWNVEGEGGEGQDEECNNCLHRWILTDIYKLYTILNITNTVIESLRRKTKNIIPFHIFDGIEPSKDLV